MSPRIKFILAGSLLLVLFQCLAKRSFAQSTTSSPSTTQEAKLFGEIALLSNYVEKGLTQTDAGPSFQAGMGYQFGPQGRLGIWGSNVKFENDNEVNTNFRAYLAYKLLFTQNVNMDLRYSFSQYFKGAGTRNTRLLDLDLIIFDYHILYQKDDNWNGRETNSVRYGFHKDWKISNNWLFGFEFGYNHVDIEGFENYFDFIGTFAYQYQTITFSLNATSVTEPQQIGSQADAAGFVALKAAF